VIPSQILEIGSAFERVYRMKVKKREMEKRYRERA